MPDAPQRPDRTEEQPDAWRRGPRRRPPWWPEDEPFPPRGGWQGRRRFFRRFLLAAGVFILLWFIAGAVIGAFIWHGTNQTRGHPGPFVGAWLFALLLHVSG